jgi:hypothetical protein
MPELGLSGSVRGVPSNGHPYRDPGSTADVSSRNKSSTTASARSCREYLGMRGIVKRLNVWAMRSGAVHKERNRAPGFGARPLLTKSVRFHGDGDIAVGGKTDLVSLDIGHQVHIDEMVV